MCGPQFFRCVDAWFFLTALCSESAVIRPLMNVNPAGQEGELPAWTLAGRQHGIALRSPHNTTVTGREAMKARFICSLVCSLVQLRSACQPQQCCYSRRRRSRRRLLNHPFQSAFLRQISTHPKASCNHKNSTSALSQLADTCHAGGYTPAIISKHSHEPAVAVVDRLIAVSLKGPFLRVRVHASAGLLGVRAVNQRQPCVRLEGCQQQEAARCLFQVPSRGLLCKPTTHCRELLLNTAGQFAESHPG